MPLDFDVLTSFIIEPTRQIVAGVTLGGTVWKFFERVEAVLKDDAKKEIARWLRVKSLETGMLMDQSVNVPETFARMFDRVFGERHLSWKCFWRSCLASFGIVAIAIALRFLTSDDPMLMLYFGLDMVMIYLVPIVICFNIIPASEEPCDSRDHERHTLFNTVVQPSSD